MIQKSLRQLVWAFFILEIKDFCDAISMAVYTQKSEYKINVCGFIFYLTIIHTNIILYLK